MGQTGQLKNRRNVGGVYLIKYTRTNHYYVGSTASFISRFSSHRRQLETKKHRNFILQRIYNKHGLGAFEFIILEVVSERAKLFCREQYYIDTLCPSFNILKVAGNSSGYIQSTETKEKRSKSRLGKKYSEATKKLLSQRAKLRLPISDEVKAKISATVTKLWANGTYDAYWERHK